MYPKLPCSHFSSTKPLRNACAGTTREERKVRHFLKGQEHNVKYWFQPKSCPSRDCVTLNNDENIEHLQAERPQWGLRFMLTFLPSPETPGIQGHRGVLSTGWWCLNVHKPRLCFPCLVCAQRVTTQGKPEVRSNFPGFSFLPMALTLSVKKTQILKELYWLFTSADWCPSTNAFRCRHS